VTEPAEVGAWEARGRVVALAEGDVWVLDQPEQHESGRDTVLVLHGFPTCSFDWRHVLPVLSQWRRVILFDFPGFGLSAKPDRRYSIRQHADVAESVCAELGLGRIALVTHDMGDSVGGELLARDLEGDLDIEITRRVLTNGSIYLELAHLTPGQLVLLDLPDSRLAPPALPGLETDEGAGMRAALAATFSADHPASDEELAALWALIARRDGHHLLPRTIRYIEDRRAEEARFTGAIERHPAPLAVMWGDRDPIADVAMVDRLAARRPEATTVVLDGVGHYPMIEAPGRLATAMVGFLDDD
jgi:pimeloyl-ACP methyl ester carboxylesterase